MEDVPAFSGCTENLVFNEAPKFIRQQLQSDTVTRGIQQGIKLGIDAIVGAPAEAPKAITAGRPVSQNFVPTAHRARKVVYSPDLDGQAAALTFLPYPRRRPGRGDQVALEDLHPVEPGRRGSGQFVLQGAGQAGGGDGQPWAAGRRRR